MSARTGRIKHRIQFRNAWLVAISDSEGNESIRIGPGVYCLSDLVKNVGEK